MTVYQTWGEVPTGVMVYNDTLRLIKISREVVVHSAVCNRLSDGWTVRGISVAPKGPFVRVSTQPEPRSWLDFADVPDGVKVRDRGGDKWRKRHSVNKFKVAGEKWTHNGAPVAAITQACGPFTEIIK